MAKRAADEYITKEDGSVPNYTDNREDGPVTMATPAQMAARKLKTPKSRMGARTTGAGAGFSGINTQQSVFAQPQQQQTSFAPAGSNGSFAFGQQSQSFPPAPSSGFTFSAPQSTSFTFGQNDSQPPATSAPSFGFGSNNTTQPAQSTTFSFGQPTQTNGQSVPPSNSFTGFGQNAQQLGGQSTQAAAPFAGFGRTPQPVNGESTLAATSFTGFGQTTQPPNGESTPTASLFGFGKSTPQLNGDTTAATPFKFGQGATQPNGGTSPAATPFSFGQSTAKSNDDNTPTPTLFSFGQQTSQSGKPFVGFGQNSRQADAESTPAKASVGFGQTTQQPNAESTPATNPFTTFGQRTSQQNGDTAPAATPFSFAAGQKPSFTFGTGPAAEAQSTDDTTMLSPPRKSPFQGLTPVPETPQSPFQPLTLAQETPNSLFQNFTPAQKESKASAPAGSTPDPAPLSQAPAPTSAPNFKTMFGSQVQAEKSKSLFQSSTPAPEEVKSAGPAEFTPEPKSLFHARAPASAPNFKSLFGSQAQTERPRSTSQTLTPAPEKPEPSSSAEYVPAPKSLFQTPASASAPKFTSLFGSQAPVVEPSTSVAAPPATQERTRPTPKAPTTFEKVKLRSNGPSEPYITDDNAKGREHDKKYRLKSLNKEFVRRLNKFDSGTQDFDNVIIFYFQTRERFGLMWPPGASNTKRKADEEGNPDQRSSPAKKTKTTESSGSNFSATPNVFNHASSSTSTSKRKADEEDVQEPRSSPAKKTKTDDLPNSSSSSAPIVSKNSAGSTFTPSRTIGTTPALTNSIKGPSSGTSNLFQSMLSASSVQGQSDKPKSPFANISLTPAQPAAISIKSTPLLAAAKPAPAKPASPSSEEIENDDDDDEQDSEEENEDESAEAEEVAEDDEEQDEDEDNDASEDGQDDQSAPLAQPENQGKSLFDRIQVPSSVSRENVATTPVSVQEKTSLKQPAPNHSFKPFTPFPPGITKSTPQAPTVSPITPFGFTPKAPITAPTPTPMPGASIFAGGAVASKGPIPGEGLFGSRPSTPSNGDPAPTNIFAGFAKIPNHNIDPTKDNTWSKGSPLKFGSSSGGTTRNWMQAFGQNAEEQQAKAEEKAKADEKYNDLGSDAEEDEIEAWEKQYEEKQHAKRVKTSNFGQGGFTPVLARTEGTSEQRSTTPPSFNITAATPPPKASAGLTALQPVASYLFASGETSGLSSRATSPGLTDNESVNNTDGEADAQTEPQVSLMSQRPGEENEEVLYEIKTKALKYLDKDAAAKQKGSTPNAYNSVGLGVLRVLKDASTGKARMVIRAEPGSNVLLNTHLLPFINYINDSRAQGSGVIRFGVPTENDKIEQWVLKVKDSTKATELAEILTDNKSSN